MRNWEAGSTRIPYAAYKLLRILRGGRLLGPEWSGWVVQGNRMWTPEGHQIEAGGMSWWSLIVRMARQYQQDARGRLQPAAGELLGRRPMPTVDSLPDAPLPSRCSPPVPQRNAAAGDSDGRRQSLASMDQEASPRGGVGGSFVPFLTSQNRPKKAAPSPSSTRILAEGVLS